MGLAPRIDVITLGVADVERALDFYRRLGWGPGVVVGTEFPATAESAGGTAGQIELEGGLLLMFYGRADLEKDAATALPVGPGPFSMGHLVASRDAVDEALRSAVEAGGTVTDPAHDRPWGIYSGYFQDLDGHLWEVISNPATGGAPEA
jgi:catechol 2,3-dioxygenase-like lactoylglutathione lyase family enzyme